MVDAPDGTRAAGTNPPLANASVIDTVDTTTARERAGEGDEAHLRRMSYFMLFRLGLLAVFTLIAGFSSYLLEDARDSFAEGLIWGTLALGYAMTLAFAWRLRRIRALAEGARRRLRTRRAAWSQTVFDIVLAAVVVQLSGGAASGFVFLYLVAVLGAATMGDRRQTWAAAGSCAVIYLTMSLLQASGAVLPTWSSGEVAAIRPTELWLDVARTLAAMGAISMLSAYLNTQLLSSVSQVGSLRVLNENIVQSLTSGLLTLDRGGRVLYANPTAHEILALGDRLADRRCEEILPGVEALLAESAGAIRRFEITLVGTEGRKRHLGLTCCPLRDSQSRFLGHVVNFQDVTEIRELEHRLRRNERLAAVGELASSVAHEVRNPLAAISGCAELLAGAELGAEDRRLLDVIRRESARLSGTVNDLLAFTRPKSPELVIVDLAQSVRDIVEALRSDPANQGIQVEVDLVAAPVRAKIDPSQFSQVLWNLLRNAVEAMNGRGRLRVSLACDDGRARLRVRDEGAGIPHELIERIFEPFFSTKPAGSGIGLALVARIVQEFGGEIDVESTVGEGTVFVVDLPLA